MTTLDAADLDNIRWAVLYAAQEARKRGCPYFEAQMRDLASKLVELEVSEELQP